MHLQIKLTEEETALYFAREVNKVHDRLALLRTLYIKACRLACGDGNPVDIVDSNGKVIDTVS